MAWKQASSSISSCLQFLDRFCGWRNPRGLANQDDKEPGCRRRLHEEENVSQSCRYDSGPDKEPIADGPRGFGAAPSLEPNTGSRVLDQQGPCLQNSRCIKSVLSPRELLIHRSSNKTLYAEL